MTDVEPTYRPSTRRVPAGACLLLVVGERVLMIQRHGAHGPGTWCFPGGWIEPREEPEVAACREAWEEVGVTVNPSLVEFLGYTSDSHSEGLHGITFFFRTTEWDGRARPTNPARVGEAKWALLRDVADAVGPSPLFLPVLNAARKELIR